MFEKSMDKYCGIFFELCDFGSDSKTYWGYI